MPPPSLMSPASPEAKERMESDGSVFSSAQFLHKERFSAPGIMVERRCGGEGSKEERRYHFPTVSTIAVQTVFISRRGGVIGRVGRSGVESHSHSRTSTKHPFTLSLRGSPDFKTVRLARLVPISIALINERFWTQTEQGNNGREESERDGIFYRHTDG